MAVVAIMKNEAPYVKEWLDYHLLAGVNHFYIYDNQDDDEQKKILEPYISAGLVTYIPYPGRVQQVAAYNNALENYKFFGRYMAFIDADEFIFPKSKPTITEVLDDILSADSQAAGVGINWQCFGTNGEKKADYSRGVLERFTRRAPTDWGYVKPGEFSDGNWLIKTVNNPRKVQMEHIHGAIFFDGYYSVNENGKPVSAPFYIIPPNNIPPLAEKIVINHYRVKSWEEAETRRPNDWRNKIYDKNEVFDDGILKYRDARLKSFEIIQGGGGVDAFFGRKQN